MTNLSLAQSYLLKARSRLKILQVLLDEGAFFPALERDRLEQLAQISARLRKEREFSFYGDIDFIPTEQYSREDAQRAMAEAQTTVEAAAGIIPALSAEERPEESGERTSGA